MSRINTIRSREHGPLCEYEYFTLQRDKSYSQSSTIRQLSCGIVAHPSFPPMVMVMVICHLPFNHFTRAAAVVVYDPPQGRIGLGKQKTTCLYRRNRCVYSAVEHINPAAPDDTVLY